MAEELGVIIDVKINDTEAQQKIANIEKKLANIGKGNNSNITLDLDSKKLESAIQSLRNQIGKSPIRIDALLNTQGINSQIRTLTRMLGQTPINIPVNFVNANGNGAATNGNVGNGGNGNGGGGVGNGGGGNRRRKGNRRSGGSDNENSKPWYDVDGAVRADDDVRTLAGKAFDKYAEELSDSNGKYKLSKSTIRYNNSTGAYNALVKYTDQLGKTTKVMLSYDAATQEVKQVRTEFTKDLEKENKIVEQNNKAQKKAQEYALKKKTGYENKLSKLGTNATKNGYTTGSQIYKDYEDAVKKAESLVNGIGNSITQNTISDIDKAIQDVENKLILANKKQKEDNDANIGLGKGNFDEGMKNASEWLKSYNIEAQKYTKYSNEIKNTQESLAKELGAAKTTEDINNFSNSIKIARKELQNFKKENQNLLSGLSVADGIDTKLASLTNFTNVLDSGKLDALGASGIAQLKTAIKSLSDEYTALQEKLRSGKLGEDETNGAVARVQELNKEFTRMSTTMTHISDQKYMDVMASRIDSLKAKYAAFADEAGAALNVPELRAQYEALGKSMETVNAVNFSTVNAQFNAFVQQVRSAGAYTKTFAASFKDAFKQITGLYSVASVLHKIASGFREVITNVTELNSCMTELRKVTDETESSYTSFLSSAGSKAQELGTTMTDYISSVSDFSKLGYNFQDAQKLAETANIYYKVGDGLSSIDDSSQSIISTMKAFGIAAEDSLGIVDLYNEIGNKFAVTSGNIGLAMQSAGAALHSSNNSLEQSVALYTAMDEIIQDQSTSSTAIKFISQRLRNTSGALTEMGEDADGAVESITKLQQQIYSLSGVNIFEKDNETFRSTYDILKDISDVWSDLNDKSRADLTRLIAGTRQASTFSALMTNFSQAEKVVAASEQAAGSAEKEHSRWSQSIEAASARATAAVQNFSQSFLNSGLVKFTYDAETGILGFLTAIIDKVGALPLAATALSGLLSTKNIGLFSKNSMTGLYSFLGKNTLAKGLSDSDKTSFSSIAQAMFASNSNVSIASGMTDAGIALDSFSEAGQKVIENLNQQNISGHAAAQMLKQYSGDLKSATKAGSSFSNVLSGIGNTLLNMGIGMAIGAAISLISKGLDHIINADKYASQSIQNLASEISDNKNTIEDLNSQLETTQIRIDELNAKPTLSIVEQEELNKLAETNKQLKMLLDIKNGINESKTTQQYEEVADRFNKKMNERTVFSYDDVLLSAYNTDQNSFKDIVGENPDSISITFAEKGKLLNKSVGMFFAEYNEALKNGDEKSADKWQELISNAQAEIIDMYDAIDNQLSDAGITERIVKDVLTPDEQTINQMFDFRETLGLYNIIASGKNASEYIVQTAKENFSSAFKEIEDYIAENGEIDATTISVKYPELTNYLKELFGWTPEKLAQQVNADYAQAEIDISLYTSKFDTLASSIASTKESYKSLTSAMDEQASAGYISLETYRALIDELPDAADWLEQTATGWKLNTDAANDYIKAQHELDLANAITRYDELGKMMLDTTSYTQDEIDAMQQERNNLLMLIDSLDSASSAYYRYKQAKKTANSGDLFDEAVSMGEEYNKTLKTGRTETDEFQAMTDFILGEGWDAGLTTIEEKRAQYAKAGKMFKKYFTDDSEKNLQNFYKLLEKNGAASFENGTWNLDESIKSVDDLVKASGMGEEAVRSFLGLAEEFGATFSFGSFIDQDTVDAAKETLAIEEQIQQTKNQINNIDSQIAENESAIAEAKASGDTDLASELEAKNDALIKAKEALTSAFDVLSGALSGEEVKATTVEDAITKLTELQAKITELETKDIDIGVNTTELDKAIAVLQGLIDKPKKANVEVDDNGTAEETKADIDANIPGEKETSVDVTDNGTAEETKADIVSASADQNATIVVGTSNLEQVDSELDNVASKERKATIDVGYNFGTGEHEINFSPELLAEAEEKFLEERQKYLSNKTTVDDDNKHWYELDGSGTKQNGTNGHWYELDGSGAKQNGTNKHWYEFDGSGTKQNTQNDDDAIARWIDEWTAADKANREQKLKSDFISNLLYDPNAYARNYTTNQNGSAYYPNGRVDLANRPSVINDNGSISTLRSSAYTLGESENIGVIVTPILPDGTEITEGQLGEYVSNLSVGSNGAITPESDPLGLVVTSMDLSGIENLEDRYAFLDELGQQIHEVQAELYGLDKSFVSERTGTAIFQSDIDSANEGIKLLKDSISELSSTGYDTSELQSEMGLVNEAATRMNDAWTTLQQTNPADTTNYAAASSALESAASDFTTAYNELAAKLGTIPDVNVSVFANTTPASTAIDRLSNKIVTVTVRTNYVGQTNASGTINAKQGMSLVDEEGAELIEHTSRGTFELGTNNGARFTSLDAGDVVHDAAETRSILKRLGTNLGSAFSKGYNVAKSVITGGAFAASTSNKNSLLAKRKKAVATLSQTSGYTPTTTTTTKKSSSKKKSSGGGGGSSSSSSSDDYLSNLFDWVEVKLTRLEEITEEWIAKAAEAIGYTAKNANLDNALKSTKDQIEATTQAVAKYNEQAAAVASHYGLAADLIEKIKNGSIEIASYTSEQQEMINGYKKYYDLAVESQQKLYDLQSDLNDLAMDQLDNVKNHYEWLIDRLDAISSKGSAMIDLKEASGIAITAQDYYDSIDATVSKITRLGEERNALVEEFNSLVSEGYIKEGTEQWYEYQSMIEDVDETIIDTKTDLIELNDKIAEINITNLKYVMNYLESVATSINDLMSLHDAQGTNATAQDYKSLIDNGMQQIDNLEAQNAELRKQLVGLDEMSEKYQDITSKINDNNSAILKMKTSQEEWADAVLDLDITKIQEYQTELKKINDKYQRQKELQQSIEDLEKARTQRTQRVFKNGQWVYEADQEAIQQAQENFDQVLHNETISKLDDIIEALDDLKDENNIYDANGNLLGSVYSLPEISDYSALLASVSSSSVVADALESTRKAIAEEIISSIDSGNTNNISIGDVYVQGAEDANGLAQAIVANLGNAILQQLYNK